jgi:hypothetical protein
MAAATKESLQGLCKSKAKCRESKDGSEVMLFKRSEQFCKVTGHLGAVE